MGVDVVLLLPLDMVIVVLLFVADFLEVEGEESTTFW